jgi:hypothetical protein
MHKGDRRGQTMLGSQGRQGEHDQTTQYNGKAAGGTGEIGRELPKPSGVCPGKVGRLEG